MNNNSESKFLNIIKALNNDLDSFMKGKKEIPFNKFFKNLNNYFSFDFIIYKSLSDNNDEISIHYPRSPKKNKYYNELCEKLISIKDINKIKHSSLIVISKEKRKNILHFLKHNKLNSLFIKKIESENTVKGYLIIFNLEFTKASSEKLLLLIDTIAAIISMKVDSTEIRKEKNKLRSLSKEMADDIDDNARFKNLFNDLKNLSVQGYLPDGTVQYWNKASEILYGYTKEEVIGKNLLDLIIPEEMREGVKQAVKQMFIEGIKIPSEELLLKHKNGSPVPVYSNHTIVNNSSGESELFCIDIDLSELKKSAQTIVEQSARMNAILNAIPDLMFIVDIDGQIVDFFASEKEKLALPKEKVIGTNISLLFDEEVYMQHINAYKRAIQTDKIQIINYDLIINFTKSYFEARIVKLEETKILAVIRDITEKTLLENEINKETELRNLLLEIAQDFVSADHSEISKSVNKSLSKVGSFVEADRSYIFNYNFTSSTLSNTHEWCAENITPEIDNLQNLPFGYFPDWIDAHRRGEIFAIEDVSRLPDGSDIKNLLESQLIKSLITFPLISTSDCIGFVGFDSVRQKRIFSEVELSLLKLYAQLLTGIIIKQMMETELLIREKKYRSIFESFMDIYYQADLNGIIKLVTPSIKEMAGYNPEEVIGLNVRHFYTNPREREKLLEELILKGVVKDYELSMLDSEGEIIQVSINAKINFDEFGKPFEIEGIMRDISERKRMESKLLIAKNQAEESNKLKDAFIANISHEIRTPLNEILGMASLMKESFAKYITDEEEEYFAGIERSSRRIIRTIDMILNFSRLQIGDFPFNPSKIDLGEICNSLVKEYKILANMKGLNLIFESSGSNFFVFADEYSITQTISNLIDNAIKFTKSGKIILNLFAGEKDKTVLVIEDTGIGIDESSIKKIFDPYHQEEVGYSRSYEGVGLGLSLVRKFVELNKACINVQTGKGKGTKFTLTFP